MQKPKFDPQKHHRRSIRIKEYDYSSGGAYFVTIVTWRRDCLFGEIVNGEMVLNALGKIADECWCAIPEHFPHVELGAYVVMPNHVHGIIVISNGESTSNVGATHWVALPRPTIIPRDQNRIRWGQSLGHSNPPFHIASTRNTTPPESGNGITTNI